MKNDWIKRVKETLNNEDYDVEFAPFTRHQREIICLRITAPDVDYLWEMPVNLYLENLELGSPTIELNGIKYDVYFPQVTL